MFKKNNTLNNIAISSFCEQINMIVKAGLPICYGISILKDNTEIPKERGLLEQIYTSLESGSSLTDALDVTNVFPHYMIRMIHLGEETGHLEQVLSSLSMYYQREEEIHSSIRHAVTYPLVISAMMLCVLVVMVTKVVPIFSDVYADLGSNLTGSAQTLMNISNFLNQYLLFFIFGFLLLCVALFFFLKSPIGKKFYEGRGFSRSLAASRFANCMYLTLSSVLDVNEGFDIAENVVENDCMKNCICHCRDLVSNGEDFAKSLLEAEIFSKMYSSLITIGYKTSSMDEVMLNISQAYEKETDEQLDHLISILEPTLIIILSIFTGLILISFLLPLLGIMSSIG